MKTCVLLSLLLALGCVHVHGAPVEQGAMEQGSCEDAFAKGAAEQALKKINKDRQEGYIFSLHRLSNVHMTKHGETGVVFYLTLDVVETNCSVLSRRDDDTCKARPTDSTPVYGQCRAVIYMNRPHRVVRLYKYNCAVRPARVNELCPDCPTSLDMSQLENQQAVTLSLEKFNKEGGLANRFALLKINRVTAGMAYYNAEYTIQETTCTNTTEDVTNCPIMECEFAHKGFCKGSLFNTPTGDKDISVECEIYEPEAAEREKKLHLLGGETDHSHNDTHPHSQDDVHTHDAKAHDHSGDSPNQHHDYKHADGVNTHEHDRELALDHDHKHGHLHHYEHQHHHHEHTHGTKDQHHPEGMVRVLPAMDPALPMTLPAFPDVPAAGPEVAVTLPMKEDPQIPGQTEPTIQAFPTSVSAQCTPPALGETLVEKLFAEDPMFKQAA